MDSRILELHKAYVDWSKSVSKVVAEHMKLTKENALRSCLEILKQNPLDMAYQVEQKLKNKQPIKQLEGIPFGVKDAFLVEWTKSTWGAKILENYQSPYTATVVKKLLDEWAILIAKENLDQFGHWSTTENSYFGPTYNAKFPNKVAGWSSGGSAANVASGVTVFSIWEDTGGSIRQPAWYNGVVGFKPSYGKVSRYGVQWYSPSLDTVWPIAKTVKDVAIVMNAISGKDKHDMTSVEHKPVDIENIEKYDFKNKKIGYYKSFMEYKWLDPDIKKSIEETFSLLKDKWAKIEELDFFDGKSLVATYYVIAMAETASELARLDGIKYGYRSKEAKTWRDVYMKTRGEWFSEETKSRIVLWNQILSQGFSSKYYQKALLARQKFIDHFKKDFEKVDFIISPVTPMKVPNIGETMDDPIAMYMSDLYTVGFSLWKLPTLSLPANSPTGIQITWAYNTDNEVIKFGYNLDKLFV